MAQSRIGITYISFAMPPLLGLRIRERARAEGSTIAGMVRRVMAAYVDEFEDEEENEAA